MLMALWCPQRSTPASLIPATTEAAVRRPPWGLSVSVLRAGLALRAPQVSLGFDPCPFSVRGWVWCVVGAADHCVEMQGYRGPMSSQCRVCLCGRGSPV